MEECDETNPCAVGQNCDLVENICHPTCDNGACDTGLGCSTANNLCYPECTAGACADATRQCDVSDGLCYVPPDCDDLGDPCTDGSCCSGLKCFNDDECVPEECEMEVGGECESNGDCCGPMFCDARECAFPHDGDGEVGDACSRIGDCLEGLSCSKNGECQEPTNLGLIIGLVAAGLLLFILVVVFIIFAIKRKEKPEE